MADAEVDRLPLLHTSVPTCWRPGVERVEARTVGVRDGKPLLADGQVLDVANVIWCTGFGKDIGWIRLPVAGDDGWPEQTRGVVPSTPGLYFVGLPFLHAFASMLVGGVGRDADHVAGHIAKRVASSEASRRSGAPVPHGGRDHAATRAAGGAQATRR